jgi:hypothetical protein
MRRGMGFLPSAQPGNRTNGTGRLWANYGNDVYASFELKEMA